MISCLQTQVVKYRYPPLQLCYYHCYYYHGHYYHRHLIAAPYNLIFADTDVVVVQDPLPLVLWQGVDYVHSINRFCPVDPVPFNYTTMEGNHLQHTHPSNGYSS